MKPKKKKAKKELKTFLNTVHTKTKEKVPGRVTIVPMINREKNTLEFGLAFCDSRFAFSPETGESIAKTYLEWGLRTEEVKLPKTKVLIKAEITKFRKLIEEHPTVFREQNIVNRKRLRLKKGRGKIKK